MIAFLLVIDLRASGPPMLEKHRNRKQEPKGGGVTLCSLLSDADVLPKKNCFASESVIQKGILMCSSPLAGLNVVVFKPLQTLYRGMVVSGN